jgi:hypothetical protein
MNSKQRAAQAVANARRSEALRLMDAEWGHRFYRLGVHVNDAEVRIRQGGITCRMSWIKSGPLGPLAGASAGVLSQRRPTEAEMLRQGLAALAVGSSRPPRTGTLFVAVADGTMHTMTFRSPSHSEADAINAEIALFNRMADIATEQGP